MLVPRRSLLFRPEFDDMKEVIFGHRDTVARIPDKLDFRLSHRPSTCSYILSPRTLQLTNVNLTSYQQSEHYGRP